VRDGIENKVAQVTKSKCTVDCTGDVCCGDVILFTENVYSGSHRKPVYRGDRWILAQVIADSYGASKQQHTFTLLLIDCGGEGSEEVRTIAVRNKGTIKRKGRNVYRYSPHRALWTNEDERKIVLKEKHQRGDAARAERSFRREDCSYEW